MDVRSFNVTPVSHFLKAEPLDRNFFFSKKISAYLNVFHRKKKKFFKHDEQKGLKKIINITNLTTKISRIKLQMFQKLCAITMF